MNAGVSALIRLRYPATCSTCGRQVDRGSQAHWSRKLRAATCTACFERQSGGPEIDHGVAGGSAAREWRRRKEQRETRIRERHGRLGRVVLALSGEPRSITSWALGATGESRLGALLDLLRERGLAVLHDRSIPGSNANIDHLVVSAAGVFVIDAKSYKGRVERRDCGGFFSVDDRLFVGGRDRMKLLAGMTRQTAAVRTALEPEHSGLPITPAICFVDADWSLLARPLRFGDVHVLWPRALRKLVLGPGRLTPGLIEAVERRLALALPPA
jgi:hypothetical protein